MSEWSKLRLSSSTDFGEREKAGGFCYDTTLSGIMLVKNLGRGEKRTEACLYTEHSLDKRADADTEKMKWVVFTGEAHFGGRDVDDGRWRSKPRITGYRRVVLSLVVMGARSRVRLRDRSCDSVGCG